VKVAHSICILRSLWNGGGVATKAPVVFGRSFFQRKFSNSKIAFGENSSHLAEFRRSKNS